MAGTGRFIQISTVVTLDGAIVLYAVDDTGNIWKMVDQPGQKVDAAEESAASLGRKTPSGGLHPTEGMA